MRKVICFLIVAFIVCFAIIMTIGQKDKEKLQKQQEGPTFEPAVEQEAMFVKAKELPTYTQTTSKRVIKVTPAPTKKKARKKKASKAIPTPKATQNPEITSVPTIEATLIVVTEEEKVLMVKVVYAEARGECFEGQVAVAAVIINRYIYNNGNISIKEIITAPYQFADISNITDEMLEEYPDCEKAVEEALKGNDPTKAKFANGARYFYQPELIENPYQLKIREGIENVKIGNHYFHNDFNE